MGRGVNSYILKRYEIALRSLKFCFYCQKSIDVVHIEHIYPLSKGGDSHIANLTAACYKCNAYKHDFTIPQFYERLIEKRQECIRKFYRYSTRYRNQYKRHNIKDEYLANKIKLFRREHSYYSAIINSIQNRKYNIQWQDL